MPLGTRPPVLSDRQKLAEVAVSVLRLGGVEDFDLIPQVGQAPLQRCRKLSRAMRVVTRMAEEHLSFLGREIHRVRSAQPVLIGPSTPCGHTNPPILEYSSQSPAASRRLTTL